jgi:hypothetical protein
MYELFRPGLARLLLSPSPTNIRSVSLFARLAGPAAIHAQTAATIGMGNDIGRLRLLCARWSMEAAG